LISPLISTLRRRRIALQAIVATIVVAIGLVVASPSAARLWAARLFAGSNDPWPQRTVLEVLGARRRDVDDRAAR